MTTHPLALYLTDCRNRRSTGATTPETSLYSPLETLLNAAAGGAKLKPRVQCFMNLKNQGGGMPDGGLFTSDQFPRGTAERRFGAGLLTPPKSPTEGLLPSARRYSPRLRPKNGDLRSTKVAWSGDHATTSCTNRRTANRRLLPLRRYGLPPRLPKKGDLRSTKVAWSGDHATTRRASGGSEKLLFRTPRPILAESQRSSAMRPFAAILFLTFASSVLAGEPILKVNLREYLKTAGIEATKNALTSELQTLNAKLSAAKKGPINRILKATGGSASDADGDKAPVYRYSFPSADEKRKMIAGLESQIKSVTASLKNPVPLPPVLSADSLKIGAVGRLRGLRHQFDEEKESRAMLVLSVINANHVLVRMGSLKGHQTEFVLNTPTAGIVDGKSIDAGDECFEVSGTTTAGGSTVFEVRSFDVKAFLSDK